MRLLFVWGGWCPKCKVLKPFIERMCNQYNIEMQYIDAQNEDEYKVNEEFLLREGVSELPMVFIYDDNSNCIMKEWFQLPGYFEEFIYLQLDDDKKE